VDGRSEISGFAGQFEEKIFFENSFVGLICFYVACNLPPLSKFTLPFPVQDCESRILRKTYSEVVVSLELQGCIRVE